MCGQGGSWTSCSTLFLPNLVLNQDSWFPSPWWWGWLLKLSFLMRMDSKSIYLGRQLPVNFICFFVVNFEALQILTKERSLKSAHTDILLILKVVFYLYTLWTSYTKPLYLWIFFLCRYHLISLIIAGTFGRAMCKQYCTVFLLFLKATTQIHLSNIRMSFI